jgi:hypothetical protein
MKRIALFATILCLVNFIPVWAADFSLSATPVEGGSALRFGRISGSDEITREVRLRVNSTAGVRYQLRQRLIDPIADERGNRLNAQAITFYTLRGSNARGSLYQDMQSSLDTSDRVLYTSDTAGDTDTIIIAYKVSASALNTSGNLMGRLAYTLMPQGPGSQQQIFLNVYIDAQGGIEIKTEITGGSKEVRLISSDKEPICEMSLNVVGAVNGEYIVRQALQGALRNETGDNLPDEVVKFTVSAKNGVSDVASPMALTGRVEKIYTGVDGNPDDTIVVKFLLDPKAMANLDSGVYRGRLLYTFESNGVGIKSVPMDIVVDIKPVFQLQLVSEDKRDVVFKDVEPGKDIEPKKVIIRIITNTKRPYSVIQKVASPLTNSAGETLPMESFTFKQQLAPEAKGSIIFSDNTPVKVGDTQIFNSDGRGTPSEFQIEYYVQPSRKYKSGNYYFNMSFALMEK